jgi:hypothetical protein
MRADELRDLARRAANVTGYRQILVLGSQAVHGALPDADLPAITTMSEEADLAVVNDLVGDTPVARHAVPVAGTCGRRESGRRPSSTRVPSSRDSTSAKHARRRAAWQLALSGCRFTPGGEARGSKVARGTRATPRARPAGF